MLVCNKIALILLWNTKLQTVAINPIFSRVLTGLIYSKFFFSRFSMCSWQWPKNFPQLLIYTFFKAFNICYVVVVTVCSNIEWRCYSAELTPTYWLLIILFFIISCILKYWMTSGILNWLLYDGYVWWMFFLCPSQRTERKNTRALHTGFCDGARMGCCAL